MYPPGHFALGYFIAIYLNRYLKEDTYLPLVLIASILPDIDILFNQYIVHRGPTHSILTMSMLFIPFYFIYRKGFTILAALYSHSLIGDYITTYGTQLFWPLTNSWYRAPPQLILCGAETMIVKSVLFVLMLIHFKLTTGDRTRIASS